MILIKEYWDLDTKNIFSGKFIILHEPNECNVRNPGKPKRGVVKNSYLIHLSKKCNFKVLTFLYADVNRSVMGTRKMLHFLGIVVDFVEKKSDFPGRLYNLVNTNWTKDCKRKSNLKMTRKAQLEQKKQIYCYFKNT